MRRGLVLAGGAARGSYALGVLLAFRRRRIQFAAAAGTSIGGMNAALWATDRVIAGARKWKSLKLTDVIRMRKAHLFGLPLILLMAHVLLFGLPYVPILTVIGGLLSLFIATVLSLIGTSLFFSGSLWWLLIAAIMMLMYLFEKSQHALLSRVSVSYLLRETLVGGRYSIPTYATLARQEYVWDPKYRRDRYAMSGDGVIYDKAVFSDNWDLKSVMVPEYRRVDTVAEAESIGILEASSAIPGLFLPASLSGRTYVDGFLADNCPAYPLVSYERCDELFVVLLERVSKTQDELNRALRSEWSRIDRILRLSSLQPDERPDQVPQHEPEAWPGKIHVFAPEMSWWAARRAALDFRGRTARKQMRLGYADGIRVLNAMGH